MGYRVEGMGDGELNHAMGSRLEFHPYVRRFRQPLKTHYGEWRDRRGILLKLTDEDERVGYGEIAPVPWFGSETLEQALAWCQKLPAELTPEMLMAIPDSLPACQFGVESAWEAINIEMAQPQLPVSALLPAGETALIVWQPLWEAGYRTFKWKIAVAALEQELEWFERLSHLLPVGAKLRLDANGGLTLEQATKWLDVCDRFPVEYLEQPLPPQQFKDLLALQANFSTAISLDESVATLQQLQHCYEQGWRGVVIIKPAITGSPTQLRQFCQTHAVDAVFSSVFETAIGRQAGLRLASELGNCDRAVGYGTTHWFEHDPHDFDVLWQTL